jgi:hypothetical protein
VVPGGELVSRLTYLVWETVELCVDPVFKSVEMIISRRQVAVVFEQGAEVVRLSAPDGVKSFVGDWDAAVTEAA